MDYQAREEPPACCTMTREEREAEPQAAPMPAGGFQICPTSPRASPALPPDRLAFPSRPGPWTWRPPRPGRTAAPARTRRGSCEDVAGTKRAAIPARALPPPLADAGPLTEAAKGCGGPGLRWKPGQGTGAPRPSPRSSKSGEGRVWSPVTVIAKMTVNMYFLWRCIMSIVFTRTISP